MRRRWGVLLAAAAFVGALSAQDRFSGSVATGTATPEALHLSLADAIARGMKTNLRGAGSQSGCPLGRGRPQAGAEPAAARMLQGA